MKHSPEIMEHRTEVLAFLKTQFPLYHQSNIFFRDIQYGLQLYLKRKGIKAGYPESEKIAREFVAGLEGEKILVAIDRQSWALHYPQFQTPPTRPSPAARPAAAAPPAARPPAPQQAPAKEKA